MFFRFLTNYFFGFFRFFPLLRLHLVPFGFRSIVFFLGHFDGSIVDNDGFLVRLFVNIADSRNFPGSSQARGALATVLIGNSPTAVA